MYVLVRVAHTVILKEFVPSSLQLRSVKINGRPWKEVLSSQMTMRGLKEIWKAYYVKEGPYSQNSLYILLQKEPPDMNYCWKVGTRNSINHMEELIGGGMLASEAILIKGEYMVFVEEEMK